MRRKSIEHKLNDIEENLLNNEGPYFVKLVGIKNRQVKALLLIICLISIMWASSVLGFLWYLNQYDFVSQDGSSINIIGDNNREVGQWDKAQG